MCFLLAPIRAPIKFPSVQLRECRRILSFDWDFTPESHFWGTIFHVLLLLNPFDGLGYSVYTCIYPSSQTPHIISAWLHLVTNTYWAHRNHRSSWSPALHLLAQVADGRYLLFFFMMFIMGFGDGSWKPLVETCSSGVLHVTFFHDVHQVV